VSFLDDITLFLAAACQAGSAAFLSAVTKTVKQTCLMVALLVVALVLLLGALGLMVAALHIGLTPYLGAHWAAMIAAAAALAGSGIFLAFALMVSRGRR
jgi:drug/metabolite transporter (DMT)-like permease